ncbi:cation efflux protein, CzcI-like [Acinetobacter tianfuensis]|nr:cation efflux protein, CzcI-like [Acinetobacter tianfuensis]
MRSAAWMTVLVGLFMFQSLWNVAAAFCVHEEQMQLQQSYHFGHHQNTLCVSNENNSQHASHQASELISKQLKTAVSDIQIGEDHQDHLPSMTHLIVQNQQTIIFNPYQPFEYSPKFDWENSYQAPDLLLQTPPPVYAPLMAG